MNVTVCSLTIANAIANGIASVIALAIAIAIEIAITIDYHWFQLRLWWNKAIMSEPNLRSLTFT